jgi:hypothetical protein
MKNELNEQTKDFVQTELKFIAKCYLESANNIKYLDNVTANKEDFIEDLLSIGDYIDKVVRELRK